MNQRIKKRMMDADHKQAGELSSNLLQLAKKYPYKQLTVAKMVTNRVNNCSGNTMAHAIY